MSNEKIKLHLGCGDKYLQGYSHIDLIDREHIDYNTSIDNLSMFSDNTVDEIYACHCLEHIKRFEIKNTLLEWYRVLKQGGELRIAVPNFSSICEEYMHTKDIKRVMGLLFGGQTYDYNYHNVCFDFNYLEELLLEVGFHCVEPYDWREFLPSDFDDFSRAYLPHMDFKNGRLMSLNIVTKK